MTDFRTSHEVMKIEQLDVDDIKAMIDYDLCKETQERALTPDRPFKRFSAESDVYFSGRETKKFYSMHVQQ